MRAILQTTAVVALSVTLGALVACSSSGDTQVTVGGTEESPPTPRISTPAPIPSAPGIQPPTGTTFTVTNEDIGGSGAYRFNPSELTFKKGQTVTLTLMAETEFHTFTVEELGIDEALGAGESSDFTFTFDTLGVFDLTCSVHPQMNGTITVE